jgi:superfamily II DNA or RNA helicase
MNEIPAHSRRRGPHDSRKIYSYICDEERWKAFITLLESEKCGKTIVYSLDRNHGIALTKHLRYRNVNAEYIDGDTKEPKRDAIFEKFRHGRTKIIISVRLLIEGVDCPSVESVVFTYPVYSRLRFQQMVGRALRGTTVGGTELCNVYSPDIINEQFDEMIYNYSYSTLGWKKKSIK